MLRARNDGRNVCYPSHIGTKLTDGVIVENDEDSWGKSSLNYSPSENDFAFNQFRVDLISSGLEFKVWHCTTTRVKGLGRIAHAVQAIA